MQLSDRASLLLGALGAQQGWQDVIYGAQPAPGANYTYQVAGDTWVRPVAVSATLTTSAVVANRFLQWRVLDANGVVLFSQPASGTVLASSVLDTNLGGGLTTTPTAVNGLTAGGLADLLVPSGWQLQWRVSGADAADQLSLITLVVQRFPTDAVQSLGY